MHVPLTIGHTVLRGTCAALLLAVAVPAAHANWLTKIAREGGEVGTRAARHGAGALDSAAAHVKALPAPTGKAAALAAHATPEGHWKFVNREGEVFTAGTADELKRAVPTLLPDAADDAKLTLYLSEDTVFGERAFLKDLPDGAALRVVAAKESYPLVRSLGGAPVQLYARVRPNLLVDLRDRALFGEALAQLERPLSRADIRTLALEPGGPAVLPSAPRVDPVSKAALVDTIDPGKLASAMRSARGQTVLITGRVENDLLHFRPQSGAEQSLRVLDIIRAASDADVNLVILHASVPRQPGGRNWLWQRIAVDGLDDALKRPTFGDFLDGLAASRGGFRVSVAREGSGRVQIRAAPDGMAGEPITGLVGDWIVEATSSITGNVVTSAVEVHARDGERQKELDSRIVPGIPSDYQIAYIVGLVCGLMGWPVARGWWARIWPPEARAEYRGTIGYRAAQGARMVAFVLLFLPLAGMPAALVALALQLVGIALLPFRFLGWLLSFVQPKTG
jgi:hypothetical protein